MSWLKTHLFDSWGDTFVLGLVRILLALVLWSRFALEVAPFYQPGPQRWALAAVFFPASAMMLIGWWGQAATLVTAGCLWAMKMYFGHHLGFEDWTHHHTNLLVIATTILGFGPCSRSLSVDAWRAPEQPQTGFLWTQHMLALQVSTLYFWSAWDKSQWAFLSGERLEMMVVRWYWFDVPDLPGFQLACMVAAWIVLVLEYVLPFALFVRRWQVVLIPVGLLLHGAFYVILPVGTFSMTMAALYLCFLDPTWLRGQLRGLSQPQAATSTHGG